ncbi:MAG: hypothetical protein HFJ48_05200 [Clostridia bacterium]|nr:hypothetical protein [Clostridia bacterium]
MSKSKRKKNNNSNKVSNLNNNVNKNGINIVLLDTTMKELDDGTEKYKNYKDFCRKYLNSNFEEKEIEELNKICEAGTGLITSYYIENADLIEKNKINPDIMTQMQNIITRSMYTITTKRFKENQEQNIKINEDITKAIESVEKTKKDFYKQSKEIKSIKNEVKTILTTIISVVLAISIIPTAISGIQNMNANYILPFLSSVVLFGMIMIAFTFSIYQNKLKNGTWILLITMGVISIIVWISSIQNVLNIDKEGNEKKEETNQNVIEKELNS